MPLHNKSILPAIIIKNPIRLMRKLRHEKIWTAIIVVVLKSNAHSRKFLPAICKRRAGRDAYLCKCPIAVVMKEKLLNHIVCYKNVGISVAVIVGECNAQSAAPLRGDT